MGGIAVTTPERTILDLGLIFPDTEVHRILLHAIGTGLVLPRDLWSMRQRTSKQGRNGTGVLERVLDALPQGTSFTESGLEILFLEVCERFGISSPVPQLPVRISGRNFRLDFAWAAQRVFVEIDGAAFILRQYRSRTTGTARTCLSRPVGPRCGSPMPTSRNGQPSAPT